MFDKRNIRIYYLKTLERIRSFLLSRNSREFLIFLFFVFVSFCFWLLQVLNDDYETEFSIPLRLKNVPSDVVLTSELPDELRIGVKDRGTVLANYMLGQTFYPIVVDSKPATNSLAPRLSVMVFSVHAKVSISIAGTIALKPSGIELQQSVKLSTLLIE